MNILLVRGSSPISWGIRLLSRSPYSHCCFVSQKRTYEADVPRLLSRPLEGYPWAYTLYRIKGLTKNEAEILLAWNESLMGKPYDYGKVVGLFFSIGFGWDRIRRLLDHRARLECYEHVFLGLTLIGRQPATDQMRGAPGDWAQDPLLEKIGDVPVCRP